MQDSNVIISGLSDIDQAAEIIISLLNNSKIIAFYGKMGVGKTTLIKAICLKMGVQNTVSSPTFSIVNEYLTAKNETIYHFDFYRINSIEETFDFGYEEYFYSNNYCFIEWPEKIGALLPDNTLHLYIKELDTGSRIVYF